jgi:hypothetical protein
MSRKPDHTSKDLRRHPVRHLPLDDPFQPGSIRGMVFSIGTERVKQHVHIRQDQWRPSIMSSRAELSFRSTPGRTPPPISETGSFTGSRWTCVRACARTNLSPCSMRAVTVSPRCSASRLAWFINPSGSLTVVLICPDIPYYERVCQLGLGEWSCSQFDNRHFVLYSYKGLASCVFCSRATTL